MHFENRYIVRVFTEEPVMWIHGKPTNGLRDVFVTTAANDVEADRIGEAKAAEHYERLEQMKWNYDAGEPVGWAGFGLTPSPAIHEFRVWFTKEAIRECVS